MDNKLKIIYNKLLSQFNIGDRVLIYKKIDSISEGWDNSWVSSMDDCVNKVGRIIYIDGEFGIVLSISTFHFPPQSLKKLDI